jgi:eukaryotic-like serine/threonine-protein kinase
VVSDSGGPGSHTFQPDELVAGRYRVIRFIARGGTGEVYEVEDFELRARVALKTLRPELAADDLLLARFRREINLSRKITHGNVCRIFDLGFHDSSRGRVTFLTMELLAGESLRRRIERAGALGPGEALPIVEQLVEGLSAAHADGVVHRDFKSDNVMLVPSPGTGCPRVVVTDFGLARSGEPSGLTTNDGSLTGTPAYMAPEQVSGGEIGPAADIYALGVVMYEMVTGKLPFEGGTAMQVALQRLTTKPRSPRRLVPDLDPRWERAILRCLELQPGRRYAKAGEVAASLRDVKARAGSRVPWGALGAVAILALGGFAAWWWGRGAVETAPSSIPAGGAPARNAVAVLGLRNLSEKPDLAWLGTALTELLASEVSGGGDLRRVPPETITRLRRELPLPEGGHLGAEALAKVRATTHADYVLAGSYLALAGPAGAQLRLEVQLQDARTGETVASASETGEQARLFEMVSQAGSSLRSRLGVRALDPADEVRARTMLPADPAAAKPYAEGLARLRLLDALGARPLLEEATKADPGFPLAHAALSEAFRRLGRHEDEEREAKLAYDHRSGLTREQQLLVEANWRVARREWDPAIELYQSLYDFFPSTVDYGLRLANVQVQGGRGKDALQTVERVRRSAETAGRDPRVDIAEAQAASSTSQFLRQDDAAKRAVGKARSLGARELEGDALMQESSAAALLGDRPRALQRAVEAHQLFLQIGNPYSVGHALLRRANASWRTGNLVGAQALFLEAQQVFEKLGDENDLARAMHGYANIESDMRHSTSALNIYRRALSMYERAGNLFGVEAMHLNIGQQLARARDLDGAEKELLLSLELTRKVGERHAEAIVDESLGGLYLDRGEPARSLETMKRATAIAQEIKDATTVAQTRRKQGEALHALGRTAEAEEAFKDGIGRLDSMGETARSGDGKLRLAMLYLDLGRLAEAEATARAALEQHERAHVDSGEAGAALARVLVAEGKISEARTVADAAVARDPDGLTGQIAAADVELAEEHPSLAIARLAEALAARLPQVPEKFEAELLLVRALAADGKKEEAQSRRRALAEEAHKKGFARVEKAASEGRLPD